jgi:SAM-dependent methyltransferase
MVCDITRESLDDRFDVIVAGDVIEHLPNPQALLEAAARLLSPGGRLLIATPNPFYVHRAFRNMRARFGDSVDHVAQFDASNIAEMAERSGLVLDKYFGIMLGPESFPSFRARVSGKMLALLPLLGFSKDALCNTMLYECVLG